MSDVISRLDTNKVNPSIIVLTESNVKDNQKSGIVYNDESLVYTFYESTMTFSRNMITSTDPNQTDILVLLRTSNVDIESIFAFFKNGGERIYSSKIEQSFGSEELTKLSVYIESNRLIDIYKSGKSSFSTN